MKYTYQKAWEKDKAMLRVKLKYWNKSHKINQKYTNRKKQIKIKVELNELEHRKRQNK